MEELILKKGNALASQVSMTIKGAGISKGMLKGMKIALKVMGHSKVPGIAIDAYGVAVNAITEKMFGGFPVPGVISIYRTKVTFEPNALSSALYKNVHAFEIDIAAIRSVRKRQLLSTSVITLELEDGECRILDGYGVLGGGRQIVEAIEAARSARPTALPSNRPPPLPTSQPPPLPTSRPPALPTQVPPASPAIQSPPSPAKGPPPLPSMQSGPARPSGPPPLPDHPG